GHPLQQPGSRLPHAHEPGPRPRARELPFRGGRGRELGAAVREDLRARGERPPLRHLPRGRRGRAADEFHAAQRHARGGSHHPAREHRRGAALFPEPPGDPARGAARPPLPAGTAGAHRPKDQPAKPTPLHRGPLALLRPRQGDLSMRRLSCLLLAILLSAPLAATAQIRLEGVDLSDEADDATKEKAAGGLGLDLREEGGAEMAAGVKARVTAATRLFDEGNYEAAALGFWEILQDPKAAQAHPRAEYMLGKSLYRMGMYHSALAIFK